MSNNFTTRSTQRERKYRNRRRPQYRSREKESSFSLSKFLLRVFGIAIILGVCGVLFIWGAYIKGAPDVGLIEKGGYFVESTVYYDGDGGEMYRESDRGVREYVMYGEISQSIKDALISAEDKGFFENPGFDIQGLFRAGLNYVTGKTSNVKGTSTLSQQLIKNTLLTNERSIKRKIQEAYLAYELNKRYSKEKILEMYLNAIEFGHGAVGIEQASKNFFGKSAKDVGPLGATILASLPKSPTQFSPYSHRDRLMGKVEAFPTTQSDNRITLSLETANGEFANIYVPFREYIKQIQFSREGNAVKACNLQERHTNTTQFPVDANGCAKFDFDKILDFLGTTRVQGTIVNEEGITEKYTLEYTVGRKDFVAYRMFEDEKIDGATFGSIWADGLEFQFEKIKHAIKYPYFVMLVKEYLETKYGDDLNIKQGLKVYTTIDPALQDEAERIVYDHVQENKKLRGANSAALVSMDNKTGRLLALVGGPDYFDEKNDGNNNMATAYRQPGSSFKPLIYALAISKFPIGNNTPVADVETKFGGWTPHNHDDAWEGIQSLSKALGHSRNIPAVKMYYLAGQEEKIKNFLASIGISLKEIDGDYGAPLALGTSEVRPIDLTQAYSVLANNGVKREMYFVEKIEDTNGGIIFEHNKKEQEIFSPAAAYITSVMLADESSRPDITEWKSNMDLGRVSAGKTGTANKPAKPGSNVIYPGDLWMAGYTPQITTVVWAGNVDGSATERNCFGLNCAAPIWNKFMRFAHGDLAVEEFQKPSGVFEYTISKLNGRLAGENTTESDKVQTYTALRLTDVDDGFKTIQVDALCGGPVTDQTPRDDIITRKVPSSAPIIDGFDPAWSKSFFAALGTAGVTTESGETLASNIPCERPSNNGSVAISFGMTGVSNNILEVQWSGDRQIKRITIEENGEILKTVDYANPKENASDRINMSRVENAGNVKVTLVDIYGYRYTKRGEVTPVETQTLNTPSQPDNDPNALPPKVSITNPKGGSISIYEGDPFNLRFSASVHTDTREISVTLDGASLHHATSGTTFIVPVSTQGVAVGTHLVSVTATDANLKSDTKTFTLNVLAR